MYYVEIACSVWLLLCSAVSLHCGEAANTDSRNVISVKHDMKSDAINNANVNALDGLGEYIADTTDSGNRLTVDIHSDSLFIVYTLKSLKEYTYTIRADSHVALDPYGIGIFDSGILRSRVGAMVVDDSIFVIALVGENGGHYVDRYYWNKESGIYTLPLPCKENISIVHSYNFILYDKNNEKISVVTRLISPAYDNRAHLIYNYREVYVYDVGRPCNANPKVITVTDRQDSIVSSVFVVDDNEELTRFYEYLLHTQRGVTGE